jgi:FkbM family methyltransferase
MLSLEKGVYLYGAGQLATFVLHQLHSIGIPIRGLIDFKASESPVSDIELIPIEKIDDDLPVIISVLNNFVDPSEIAARLTKSYSREVITPPQIFHFFGQNGLNVEWYWLSSEEGTSISDSGKNFLVQNFDDLSKHTLENIYSYRSSGIYKSNHMLELHSQYIDTGIENFWDGEIFLLDGGAFDGDTVHSLNRNGILPMRTYCFEPDFPNYLKLVSRSQTLKVETIPIFAALSDRCGKSYFNQASNTASSLQNLDSGKEVLVVDADSILINERITHIKLDLEGSELDALAGMRNLIAKNLPKLAISVYHKPNDLEEVLRFVKSFNSYDRFSLRNYAHQGFETIFYATSSKSL